MAGPVEIISFGLDIYSTIFLTDTAPYPAWGHYDRWLNWEKAVGAGQTAHFLVKVKLNKFKLPLVNWSQEIHLNMHYPLTMVRWIGVEDAVLGSSWIWGLQVIKGKADDQFEDPRVTPLNVYGNFKKHSILTQSSNLCCLESFQCSSIL